MTTTGRSSVNCASRAGSSPIVPATNCWSGRVARAIATAGVAGSSPAVMARADQSRFRNSTPLAAFDADRGILEFNPLFGLSREAMLAIAQQWDVPVNPLHQAGYASIGCAPCTRATRPGEPERAGRWWWEAETRKECGLHLDRHAALQGA